MKKKRNAKKLSAKVAKSQVVRALPNRPTQDERKPERITAWANASAATAGAVTAVFVSVKAGIEVLAALKSAATLKAAAMFGSRFVHWGALLYILIMLAVSLLNGPHGLLPWGKTEFVELIIQIASA